MEKKKLYDLIGLVCLAVLLFVLIFNHLQANKSQKLDLPDDAQTLSASADGKVGPVEVEVIANQSEIFKVRVTNHTETDGIGTNAVDQIPGAIVEKQSLAVDAVSGATITSDAIQKAVAEAMTAGGIDPSAFGFVAAAEPVEEPAPAEEAVAAPAEPAAESGTAGYVPGTYTGEGTGMGKVVVNVTVDESSITAVEIDGSGETPEIGGAALGTLTDQVLAAQGTGIDGVAGASLTSEAVRTAVAAALAQASAGAGDTAPAEEAEPDAAPAEAAEPEAEAAVPAEGNSGMFIPGTYTAEAQGMGKVIVNVTVDESSITAIEIDGSGETPGIGAAAIDPLKEQVLAAQGAAIDGVSGATITSTAVRTAVEAALAEAAAGAGDAAAVETKESESEAAAVAQTPEGTITETGSGQGIDGPVVVQVTADAEKIYSVEVLEQNETPGIGSVAVEKLPGAIVEANSLLVDGISGATVTSTAIKTAVTEALTKAGLDASVFEKEPDTGTEPTESAETTSESYDVDVVVIGAGGAGMTAAITAHDEGRTVLVLESQGMVGGNSVRSTGGMNAAPTEWQQTNEFAESAGVESTLKKVANYPDNERIQELGTIVAEQWASYQENPDGYFDSAELFQLDTLIGGGGMNDPSLVKKLVENSESAIAWLDQLDPEIVLHNVAQFGGAAVKRIHRPVDAEGKTLSVGAYVVPLLQQNLEARGVELLLDTTATEILTDESGAAIGVVAETKNGESITVNAKAVVIASGGFGANNDMIASIRPDLDGFITTNAPGIQGQGIKMAQSINADTVDLEQIQLHPTVHVEGNSAVLITEGLRGDGAILVNQEGERFFDEVSTRDKVSAAEFEQTGGYAWLIVDSRMSDASNVIQGYISKGYAESGETYEDLAEAIGAPVDAFTATIEKWNACVNAKEDADFGRVSFANPLDQAPFYAIKVQPGIHHTMGGIKINDNAQVISTDGNVIPGLFAAGEVTGGVHGNNRLGGNAVADFTIFGRIAGSSASVYAGGEMSPAEEAASPEGENFGIYVPGTYTAEAQGMGKVIVNVTVDENGITAVEIDGSGETPGIGAAAIEPLQEQVMTAQSAEVDGVSGATITSNAVRTAVAAALEQAASAESGSTPAENEEEPEAAGETATVLGILDDGSDGKTVAHKVETMSGVQILYATDWEEQYPEIYASFMKNQENDEILNYLEEYPQLVTLYEPYGFSKSYGSARGHFYDVDDILETGRPHKLAQCWTCKTPDFTNMANEIGAEVYQYDFDKVRELVNEGISCYSCHANNPGEITVTHTYVIDALGEDFDKVAPANLACGQCHVEYYFYPGTGVTSLPRFNLETMHPDSILDYYNNVLVDEEGLGFTDYTNPRTGVRQIKVQHPEFETYLGKGSIHAGQFTCADCHMGTVEAEDGSTYANHYLTSPLDNQKLIDSTCSTCHADLVSEVHAVQEKADMKTRAVADKLVDLTEKLAVAVDSGNYTDDQLDPIRAVARDAQFYWDWVFVENSNGAHNPSMTTECLDKAEQLAEQALRLLAEKTAEADQPEEGVPSAENSGMYAPGTYTAEAQGMGKVIVSVTVDENGITAIEIDGSGETPGIGAAAIGPLQEQVMTAQSAEVDGVAGATITSNAVRTAVEAALAEAMAA